MNVKRKTACMMAEAMRRIVNELFDLSKASEYQIGLACMSVLADMYQNFDSKVPANTKLPPAR